MLNELLLSAVAAHDQALEKIVELGDLLAQLAGEEAYALSPASLTTPVSERRIRQALVIEAVITAGGKVPYPRFLILLARYGYLPRVASSFLRTESSFCRDGDDIIVTEHGHRLLSQYRTQVDDALDVIARGDQPL